VPADNVPLHCRGLIIGLKRDNEHRTWGSDAPLLPNCSKLSSHPGLALTLNISLESGFPGSNAAPCMDGRSLTSQRVTIRYVEHCPLQEVNFVTRGIFRQLDILFSRLSQPLKRHSKRRHKESSYETEGFPILSRSTPAMRRCELHGSVYYEVIQCVTQRIRALYDNVDSLDIADSLKAKIKTFLTHPTSLFPLLQDP
jgi:hypothetical protein